MHILITGGTGFIGRHLCAALLQAGHALTVLSSSPQTVAAKCGAGVKAMASLNDWQADTAFDAIINLAGEPIVDAPWTAQRKQKLWDSRVTLTKQLVEKIAQSTHKPKVLLSGSAIGFYGDTGDVEITESAAAAIATTDFGAQLCAAWEAAALQAEQFQTRVCLLRTGLVLHPSGGMLGKMLTPFKLGLGARLGNGQQWMSWIHLDDHVALVLKLLESPHATGAFNMTAPQPVTNQTFTQQLAKSLGRPAWWVAPAWVLKLALGQRAYLLLGGQKVLPAKALALGKELGFEFAFADLERALHAKSA